jgi:hypothetical protein
MTIFDSKEAEEEKAIGLKKAGGHKAGILTFARRLARKHCQMYGKATIDDVMADLFACGIQPEALGKAAGAVFRTSNFAPTGSYRKSTRVSNHARPVMIWELSNEETRRKARD